MSSIEDYYQKSKSQPYSLTKDHVKAGEIVGTSFYPNKFNQLITEYCDLNENIKGYQERIEQLLQNNTICAQADGFNAVAVWTPPEWRIVPYSCELTGSFAFSEDEFKRCATKFFKNEIPFWHLTFVAKNVEDNGAKGSVSKVMKPFLQDAKERGIPAALECIDERAKEIYEHYGFKTYEIIKIGEGEVNQQGEPDKDGEGLNVYYMIYNYDDVDYQPVDTKKYSDF
jgi:hypothetical protein